MTVLSLVTLLMALLQASFMSRQSGLRCSPQLFIIILVMVQLVLLAVHYGLLRDLVAFKIAQRYIHILEFCLTCFFFANLALRVSGKRNLIRRVLIPSLAGILTFITIVFAIAIMWRDNVLVQDIDWLVLSISYTIISFAFAIVGCLITVQNRGNSRFRFRMKKSHRLWCLIFVNFVAAVIATASDISTLIRRRASPESSHLPSSDMVLWYFHGILTNIVPLWAVQVVLWSLPQPFRSNHAQNLATPLSSEQVMQSEDDLLFGYDDLGTFDSSSIPYSASAYSDGSYVPISSPWSTFASTPPRPQPAQPPVPKI
eukprot:c10750_g1_i1.p1 GENE.c10750_g1_i1~~c10750_g1_i1.p1  ORF type:complete len:333 (+),score=54.75 c10750_g1_i1:59-1000(+)